MPTVSNAARITSKDGTVWRTCGGCGALAALPPDVNLCPGCQPDTDASSVPLRVEHFGSGDLFEIRMAGSVFARAVADVAHHEIGDPGVWDCYGAPPEELARLRNTLDRITAAIKETRAQLAVVERRARRQAVRQQGRSA
jgi:hypothetical protein